MEIEDEEVKMGVEMEEGMLMGESVDVDPQAQQELQQEVEPMVEPMEEVSPSPVSLPKVEKTTKILEYDLFKDFCSKYEMKNVIDSYETAKLIAVFGFYDIEYNYPWVKNLRELCEYGPKNPESLSLIKEILSTNSDDVAILMNRILKVLSYTRKKAPSRRHIGYGREAIEEREDAAEELEREGFIE